MSPDLLALLALGEPVGSPEEHAHLSGCAECRAELQALRSVVEVGRRSTEGDVLASPPPHVWLRIQRELELTGFRSGLPDAGPLDPAPLAEDVPVGEVPAPPDRRGVRAAAFALAAVLTLVVGIGLAVDLGRPAPAETEVASVQLNAVPPFVGSSGQARVERDRDGSRVLVVQISSPAAATGPREVWLTNTTAEPMVPMGYLSGNSGRFPIPAGLKMSESPLVDVSQEPVHDTDPDHSGHSMLRGRLPL